MAKKNAIPDSYDPRASLTIPIVAIGGSAGGQEAMVELLHHLPSTTGLAYVYVQHLDPTQANSLIDILSQATTMPVHTAEHQMPVEANHLYIIPPDLDLEVFDGVMALVPRKARSVIHMPIDRFFLSLAERQKKGSIAVILSGTASDGTLGLRAIKAAGGITFAQDETARFQSMPRSAIVEGVVDRVLSPIEIAHELERLSEQTSVFQQTTLTESQEAEQLETLLSEPTAGSNEDLRNIIQLLRRATGVDFSHYKVTTIRRRIIRRTLLYKLDSLRDYAEYLRHHPEEASLLYDDLLINVTTFFRDVDTMDYLQKVLIPQLIRDKPAQDPLRIWVPACSTGQEAYSIAMLLMEVLGDRALTRTIQLFATDLSETAVAKARLGSYTRGEVMDVSPRRLQRFFTKVDDHYRINKSVRDLCVFAPHNLLKDPPFSRLDLISCRNLLIYLDTTLQRKAIVTFHYALNPNGYLLLGKSETVGSSAPLFSQLEKNYKVFSRKNDVDSRATFTMTPRQLEGDRLSQRQSIIPKTIGSSGNDQLSRIPTTGQDRWGSQAPDLDKVVDNLLLNQYVPASVVVNQDLEILQFRGSTGLFLEPAPGKASLNLIKMARPSLVFELRNAVHKAQKSNEPVRKSGLEIKVKNKIHYVAIEAVPLDTATEERLFLIIFEEIEPPVAPITRSADARNRRIKELEDELANLREDMRSIIEEQEASNEELQSANEEIISSNEELQSINEELETSKEEIESTNEELLTINQELQVRNDQLSEAHQFAEDIFSTIREATLVLDTDLRVKSANQAFYRLFQLDEGAIERRLIYELGNRQWDIPELRLMLTDIVTTDAQFQGFELTYKSSDIGEKTLSLNARRVVRQHDSILLAIEDITEHRRAQRLLAEREAWFHQIADNVPSLIWVMDADGQFTFLNKVWLQYTGLSIEDIRRNGISWPLHPDDQANYQVSFSENVQLRQGFTNEYRLRRHDGRYHWMLENAQPIFGTDGTFNGYIGSSTDIHLQKELNQELDRRVEERTKELAQSSELMRIALDASQAGLGRWNWSDNTTSWDGRSKQIIGFSNESEMLKTDGWFNRIHPGDLERVKAEIQASIITGHDFQTEYRVVHDDGSVHFVLGAVRINQESTGNSSDAIGFIMDITALKRAEDTIRHTATQLSTLVENTPDVITRWSKDLRLQFANSAFIEKTGQPLEALLGKTNLEMGQPDSIAGPYMDKLRKTFETGKPQEHFNEFPTPGRPTQYFARIVPEFGADGSIESVLAIARDITDLQQAELNFQQTAQNLQAVLNSSPAAIGFLKPIRTSEQIVVDFRLVVCNKEFAHIAGRSINQTMGLLASQLASGLWHEQTVDNIRHTLESGEPFQEERHNPESDQWMLISLVKYDDGVVLTGQDITALKKAEEQQSSVLEELEKSNENIQAIVQLREQIRERGELLRSSSHDLRGNFGIIQGAATLLDLAKSDEERQQMMSMLQRNLKQATHMLSELLDVARLEAGQEQRQIDTVDAAKVLNELIESLQPLANERELWIRTEGNPSLIVEGDSVKIRRMVQNLLLNALKYTETGGVTVRWEVPSTDYWQLSIADTGPGLHGNPHMNSGEGVGLLIVKQLCELLKCQMEVDSKPGEGTRYTLIFPSKYSN